jgi:hypothetical protein
MAINYTPLDACRTPLPSDASLRLETQLNLFILEFRFSSFRAMDR